MRKRVTAPARTRSMSRAPKKANRRDVIPRFSYLKSNFHNKLTQTYRGELIYSGSLTLNPGAATTASYVFGSNALYDADITGAGHQPTGFDELMGVYGEYVVIGSTIKVDFANSASVPLLCGITAQNGSTTSSDPKVYVENGATVWSVASVLQGSRDVLTLKHQMDISKFAGNKNILVDNQFSGGSGSNPIELRYFIIWVAAADGASDPGPATCFVEIKFDAFFRAPIQTPLS